MQPVCVKLIDAKQTKEDVYGYLKEQNDISVTIELIEGGTGVFPCEEVTSINKISKNKLEQFRRTPEPDAIKFSQVKTKAPTSIKRGAPMKAVASEQTSKQRAVAHFKSNPHISKQEMVAWLQSELGMTSAGATTYWYIAKKG